MDGDLEPQDTWNKFDLNSLTVKCLIENGFKTPTEIQCHSLPYYKYRTDLIIASRTVRHFYTNRQVSNLII